MFERREGVLARSTGGQFFGSDALAQPCCNLIAQGSVLGSLHLGRNLHLDVLELLHQLLLRNIHFRKSAVQLCSYASVEPSQNVVICVHAASRAKEHEVRWYKSHRIVNIKSEVRPCTS